MLSFIVVAIFGMLTGMAVGLLPVLPIYVGPFFLYFFMDYVGIEQLLIYWITVLIGSQYFGSISSITLRVPGEASSLVYINDLNAMSLNKRRELLFSTAAGSLFATVVGLGLVYLAVSVLQANQVSFFTTAGFQVVAYTFAIASFALINKNVWITALSIVAGIMLGPRNNYALPESWYQLQLLFEGTTLYMVVLGMMIIPHVLYYNGKPEDAPLIGGVVKSFVRIGRLIKSTSIGCLAGLIPGPCAELASAVAYRTQQGQPEKKIVAAETANNSAVMTLLIPFFVLGLPITQSTIIFSNILDIKMIEITEVISAPSEMFGGMTLVDGILLTLLFVAFIYYYLATQFIDIYAKVVSTLHSKMKVVMIVLVALMIISDTIVSETQLINYILLLIFYTGIGIMMHRKEINPIPFMFALLLGDKLIWAYIQFYQLNLG